MSGRKNSLKTEFLGRIFLGHQGPRHRDIPDKSFMQVAFLYCLDREWLGCPGIWAGTSRIGKTLFKHRQVTDLDVTDLRFSGLRIPFCATGPLWGHVTPFSQSLF